MVMKELNGGKTGSECDLRGVTHWRDSGVTPTDELCRFPANRFDGVPVGVHD